MTSFLLYLLLKYYIYYKKQTKSRGTNGRLYDV